MAGSSAARRLGTLALWVLAVTSANAADLYVCTQGGPVGTGHLYRHLGGTSWEKVTEGVQLGQSLLSVETYRGRLVVGAQSASGYAGWGGYGLVWEYSGGEWTRIGVLDEAACVLFVLADRLYCATSLQRIYRYEDVPGQWTLVASYDAGTGFRAGVVADLRGKPEAFLGELDRDTFFRYGPDQGLAFLANFWRSCVYSMARHAGGVYAGCWHGSWYRTTDGQHVEPMGIMGPDHVWGMASFRGALYIGSGAGQLGDPGRLRVWDGRSLQIVREFPATRYAEGVSALCPAPDGSLLYIGLGMSDGYYSGDGQAEVWTFDGQSYQRICEPDFFGGGVQFMAFLDPQPSLELLCVAPRRLEPGGHAVVTLKATGVKLEGLADLTIDVPAAWGCLRQTIPASWPTRTDTNGFTSQVTSVVTNGDGTTTITVRVTSGAGSKSLSHIVFGLPPGARALAARTATSSGGWTVEVVDPDPRTGVSGIKYDETALGGDGKTESATFTFSVPTGSASDLVVATKAGRDAAQVTHTLFTTTREPPEVEQVDLAGGKISLTLHACHGTPPGDYTVRFRLADPRASEVELAFTVVASRLPEAERAAYLALQQAICELRAARRNLDDPVIASGLPGALTLPEAGLAGLAVQRTTTCQVAQHGFSRTRQASSGMDPVVRTGSYVYITPYARAGVEDYRSRSATYSLDWESEYRVGVEATSEIPENALAVRKVSLLVRPGTRSRTPSQPFATWVGRMSSSPFLPGSWPEMTGQDASFGAMAYTPVEVDLAGIFDGRGTLRLALHSDLARNTGRYGWSGSWGGSYTYSFSWSVMYLSYGPGYQPELRLEYLRGYTPREVFRLVLHKICHEQDGAGAWKIALAFNQAYGKTAAQWGLCR